MLHLLAGTAGTGKTTRLIREIQKTVQTGRKAILIVPEQYSFEGETLIYRALGPKDSLMVETLSFTRLCDSIFRRFGGLAGVNVSGTAKYLIMSVVVDELRDSLSVYRKSASNTAFLETLLGVCSEFKAAGVSPEALSAFAGRCESESLREKTQDLSAVYAAYQAMLSQGYRDPEDDLVRACALLEQNVFFENTAVFVDGFAAFMAAEHRLLRHIISQADDVWAAFTADEIYDSHGGTGGFSAVQATMNRLMRAARELGVPVASPVILTEPVRYHSDALKTLSTGFLSPEQQSADGAPDGVYLYAAENPYDEVAFTASAITELVRGGMCYRDIAVVARDTAPYLSAMELLFGHRAIPWFSDRTDSIENRPLAAALSSALDCVRGNYDAESVLTLAKSPAMGFSAEAVAELENYCYVWGIRGAAWHRDFVNSPRGLSDILTDEDRTALARINALRAALTEPLSRLDAALRKETGRDFARGVFAFLEAVGAPDNLTAHARTLGQAEREQFLDDSAQLWDAIVGILDIFGQVIGPVHMKRGRLCELFRLALASAEIGGVPQTIDQVIVGSADRIRPGEVRAVFVLGANEGIFPPSVSGGGVFSDTERMQLIDAGLEISAPGLRQVVLEQYFAYYALTLPREALYVSWARADMRGTALQPSMIVSRLQEMFSSFHPAADARDPLWGIAGERSALSLLAERFHEDSALTASLLSWFGEKADPALLDRMERVSAESPHRLSDPAAIKGLFGSTMRLSPSRVERWHRCPFSFFAADALRLQVRRKADFSPIESGSVIHHVLQVMVQKYGGKGLCAVSEADLEAEVRSVIGAYVEARVEDAENLSVRFRYLFDRLCSTLVRLLRHLGAEFSQSLFEPVAFELPIRQGDGLEPLHLKTPGGTDVFVEGVVDRVDVMTAKNGRRYVRVVDYKSGRKDFQLSDILYGLNLQMLLYLFTIAKNGAGILEGALPAGVLYMPASEQYVQAGRADSAEDIAGTREKQWRMSGLILDDEEVVRGMEADVAGLFIPVKLASDGTPDKRSSLADSARMGKLAHRVNDLIVRMAGALGEGEVAALPTDSGDPCAYCDYRAVCGFEEGGRTRPAPALSREEVFRVLEEEDYA